MIGRHRTIQTSLQASLLCVGVLCLPARAQEVERPSTPTPTPEFIVEPRFSVTYRSGDSNISDRGEFSGFVPLLQTPERNLLFINATTQLDRGALRTGSISVGNRLRLDDNLILGGYLGYDIRDTGNNTFNQLGAGLELLGPGWDLHLNGYIPVGQSQQTVAGTLAINNSTFQGNQLRLDVQEQLEQSLGGVELEAGLRLAELGEGGTLWGYGGAYYLGNTVGGRLRLSHTIANNINLGLGVQSDGIFGTRGFFSVGYSFGGQSRIDERNDNPLWQRVGEPIQRNNTIAVEHRIVNIPNQIATNPATGQPWRFVHVTDGAVGGTGSAESPLGQVTDAASLAQTLGNDIIYVDAGDRSGMAGFTIPTNVQVRSTGVPQTVTSTVTGSLGQNSTLSTQISGSGTGTLPLVQSTVTMGNGSTLSGFDVQSGNNRGVYARNVSDFTVDRNQITTTARQGINAYASTGETINNAVISGNTVTTTGFFSSNGIQAYAYQGGTISNSTISGNTVTTTGLFSNRGIDISAYYGTVDNTSVSGNNISTTGISSEGIHTYTYGGTVSNTTISGNNISTTGRRSAGIRTYNRSGTINNTTISGNTASTTGDFSNGIHLYAYDNTQNNGTTISSNRITTTGQRSIGVYTYAYGGTVDNTTISGNTVATAGSNADGIHAYVYGGGTMNNTIISGNTVSTAGSTAQGIDLNAYDGTINNVTVSGNNIQQAGQHSVLIRTENAASNICIARLSGNTSDGPNAAGAGGNDLNITVAAGSTVRFSDFSNVATNNTGFNDILGSPTGQPTTCP